MSYWEAISALAAARCLTIERAMVILGPRAEWEKQVAKNAAEEESA